MYANLPHATTAAPVRAPDSAQTVDDFWRAADAVWLRSQSGPAVAERSAARLRARLARRAHRRSAEADR